MSENSNMVTDLSYLREISKGNSAFIDEMIDIFLTENPKELSDLENAINQKDFSAMKEAAHKMKSTIPFVGIDKLIEKDLVQIENLSLERSGLEQIKTAFFTIKKICSQAAEELKT